jgi:hypothetical protein
MNRKDPADRKDVLLKTYVPEWMAEMAYKLAKEAGGMANFLRIQIPKAWDARHGKGVFIPLVGGPLPAWRVSTNPLTGEQLATATVDELVAVPWGSLADMREQYNSFEQDFRGICNYASKLQWALLQLCGSREKYCELLNQAENLATEVNQPHKWRAHLWQNRIDGW